MLDEIEGLRSDADALVTEEVASACRSWVCVAREEAVEAASSPSDSGLRSAFVIRSLEPEAGFELTSLVFDLSDDDLLEGVAERQLCSDLGGCPRAVCSAIEADLGSSEMDGDITLDVRHCLFCSISLPRLPNAESCNESWSNLGKSNMGRL